MNQQIPPEVMQAYMQQLTLEEQDQDLQRQLAMAQELMKQGPERYGPIGQGLQTIADLMNAYKGGSAMREAQSGREALRPQRQTGREVVGDWWLGTQNPQSQGPTEAPIPDAAAPLEDFSGMTADVIPDLLRAPLEQYGPAGGNPSGAGLNVGVAKVPPPLTPEQLKQRIAGFGG